MDRGFITRSQGIERLTKIVNFLEHAQRYHGAWSHYMDGSTGKTMPVFGMFDNGGDLVETSFLMEGCWRHDSIFAETARRERSLPAYLLNSGNPSNGIGIAAREPGDFIYWHWSAEWGWQIQHPLIGFNEVMITYLLAMSSPTSRRFRQTCTTRDGQANRQRAISYRAGWSGSTDGDHYGNGHTYYGIKLDVGVGTGGRSSSHITRSFGFDPHSLHDRYTSSYFENNRNIALINRAYCIATRNIFQATAADAWGLTASDGPEGYVPHAPDDSTTAER